MAETGGYIAGTKRAVELASYRLTSVGVGCEVGARTVARNDRDVARGGSGGGPGRGGRSGWGAGSGRTGGGRAGGV